MWQRLKRIFRENPDYRLITLGIILSEIGMALTGVAVYGELAQRGAAPLWFSLTFILEVVPGVLTGFLARRFFLSKSMTLNLVGAELIGGLLILIPLIGSAVDILPLTLVAASLSSAVLGFMLPFHDTHMRRVLKDDDIAAISMLSTYTLAAVFILGTLLGTLLYTQVGTVFYFALDAGTYFVSAAFTLLATRLRPANFAAIQQPNATPLVFRFHNLNPTQKKAFLLNLFLTLNCAPATAILPAVASRFDFDIHFGHFTLVTSLVFVVFKMIGQLLGPLVVGRFDFDRLVHHPWLVSLCLLVFHALYFIVFNTSTLWVALSAITLAHVASNVIFILGFYSMKRFFNAENIGVVSSHQHQYSIALVVFSSLWAGYAAEEFGYNSIALVTLLLFGLVVYMSRQSSHSTEAAELNTNV